MAYISKIKSGDAYFDIKDTYARDRIADLATNGTGGGTPDGSHWYGKTWYAYGTSLTSTAQGKYVPRVAELAGLKVVNKGIGGGGIVANTQIKDAVMNTTDGKLNADLITLEVGANDAAVPLGTIYDTGSTTFCGALNQCIRYLQTNTTAQIVVISSTNSNKAPEHEYPGAGGGTTGGGTTGGGPDISGSIEWQTGSVVNGVISVGTRRVAILPSSAAGVTVTDTSKYSVTVYAYDTTKGEVNTNAAYVGKLQDDGSFGDGTISWVDVIDLTQYSANYQFVIACKRDDGSNSVAGDESSIVITGAGDSDAGVATAAANTHTRFDQWEATRKVCMINSVPYIPMGEEGGLGYARMTSAYLVDSIHHTAVGGYNLAQFVWSRLKNIPLWSIVV